MPTVALATCQQFPDLDDDDRLVIPALADLGIAAVPAVWTDDGVDWSAFDAVVIRGTWDYHDDRAGFLAWTAHVAEVTTLLNPAPVIAWNTDKRYLRDLAAAGVPIVPTVFLEPGVDDAESEALPGTGDDIVVKPAVSAGSRNTMRFAPDESGAARAHARRLLDEGRVVMVQPYLDAVDTVGETALLHFDGVLSHAIRKGPLLERGVAGEHVAGLFLAENIEPREPSGGERDVARAALAAVPEAFGRVLYARVDLIPDAAGQPRLLELELTEPSLFLVHAPSAPQRLAAAIAARL